MSFPKENLYWLVLFGFGFLALISITLLLNQRQSTIPHHKTNVLGKSYKTGTFRIDGPSEIAINTPFQVKFIVDTNKQAANAVGLEATFDPEKITINNIDTSQSFCQFYPKNKFDNLRGTISISCGAPNPGFKGENTIAVVNFFSKNIGSASIHVNNKSLILLNDGKGTNIFDEPVEHQLVILNNI